MAVTAVDSGSKALEFLGFNEDQQRNTDQPSVFPNNHHVIFPPFLFNIQFLRVFYFLGISSDLYFSGFLKIFFDFPGSGSKFDYYRLLHAWNDRL